MSCTERGPDVILQITPRDAARMFINFSLGSPNALPRDHRRSLPSEMNPYVSPSRVTDVRIDGGRERGGRDRSRARRVLAIRVNDSRAARDPLRLARKSRLTSSRIRDAFVRSRSRTRTRFEISTDNKDRTGRAGPMGNGIPIEWK